MKTLLLLIVLCGGAAFAQDAPPSPFLNTVTSPNIYKADAPKLAALSRETLLELQILANREKEIREKLQPVIDLLLEPVNQARAVAVERACKAAGIPLQEKGQPTCELDPKAGTVRRLPAAASNSRE